MSSDNKPDKRIRSYMISLILISFAAYAYSYRQILESYNSTVLAFSYRYGFISRGLIGTLYAGLNKLIPIDIYSYKRALMTMTIVSLVIFVVLIYIAYRMVVMCPSAYRFVVELAWVFIMMAVVTTFSSKRNLGRLDIFMILISIVAVYLIIRDKLLWLCIPLSALGVMVHQGYVFMYLGLILALLLYRYITTKRGYYAAVFLGSLLIASALFVWFQFFSHMNAPEIVSDITASAEALSKGGKYHKTLIEAEIMGVDLTAVERPMHVENLIELPFFLMLMSPYIVILVKLIRQVYGICVSASDKFKYAVLLAGALTTLPLFILKVDYARWVLAVGLYYLIVIMALVIMGDDKISLSISELADEVRVSKVAYSILVIYPVLFLPLWDVHICQALSSISNPINEAFLHLW